MSVAMILAIWSERSRIRSAAAARILPRSAGSVADQEGKAARAAATAASTSAGAPAGTLSISSSVAGLTTSMLSPDADACQAPFR